MRRSSIALVCVVALVALAPRFLAAQATPPAFTQADLMNTVKTLASSEMAGRQAGTAGNEKARAWVL